MEKMLKTSKITKYLSILISLTAVLLVFACNNNSINTFKNVNAELIDYQSFFITAQDIGLDSFVRGTIFVYGDVNEQKNRQVRIIGWVEVDPEDWGGVSFNISDGWQITSISSDYPQDEYDPERYVTVLETKAETDYPTVITIGRSENSNKIIGTGQGNILIELALSPSIITPPDNLEIKIGVGSKNGLTLNPVFKSITLSLK